mgnify:CR=1 FL=1
MAHGNDHSILDVQTNASDMVKSQLRNLRAHGNDHAILDVQANASGNSVVNAIIGASC